MIILKDCPLCGKQPDLQDGDTLYPINIFWKDTPDGRMYGSRNTLELPQGQSWTMHCPVTAGGCGMEISGDSKQETIDAWNRRPDDKPIVVIEFEQSRCNIRVIGKQTKDTDAVMIHCYNMLESKRQNYVAIDSALKQEILQCVQHFIRTNKYDVEAKVL